MINFLTLPKGKYFNKEFCVMKYFPNYAKWYLICRWGKSVEHQKLLEILHCCLFPNTIFNSYFYTLEMTLHIILVQTQWDTSEICYYSGVQFNQAIGNSMNTENHMKYKSWQLVSIIHFKYGLWEANIEIRVTSRGLL